MSVLLYQCVVQHEPHEGNPVLQLPRGQHVKFENQVNHTVFNRPLVTELELASEVTDILTALNLADQASVLLKLDVKSLVDARDFFNPLFANPPPNAGKFSEIKYYRAMCLRLHSAAVASDNFMK